jgi:hypothetical protein
LRSQAVELMAQGTRYPDVIALRAVATEDSLTADWP